MDVESMYCNTCHSLCIGVVTVYDTKAPDPVIRPPLTLTFHGPDPVALELAPPDNRYSSPPSVFLVFWGDRVRGCGIMPSLIWNTFSTTKCNMHPRCLNASAPILILPIHASGLWTTGFHTTSEHCHMTMSYCSALCTFIGNPSFPEIVLVL